MSRLLNANFARLFKGKLFWICAAAAFAFGVVETMLNKGTKVMDKQIVSPEGALFEYSGLFFLVLTAVFSGIFVGAEHGGALRNKIIAGQKRVFVFLSNAVTCSAAIAVIHLLFIATTLLSGLFRGGEFLLSFGEIALCELLQLLSLVETSVLFSAVALLRREKLDGAVISLLIVFILWLLNGFSSYNLDSLKYSYGSYYDDTPMYLVEEENITAGEQIQIAFYESIRSITPFG